MGEPRLKEKTASMLIHALLLLLLSGLAFAAPTFPVLTYSTYLRDSFTPKAIATDSSGNIYLAGNAIVDPATSQSTVLVVKLNPQASQYLYVRYLGGSVKDSANAIAVDAAGNAYVAGSTASPDFPVTSGGNPGTSPGPSSQRSFVAKLDPSGGLAFSVLLGGSASSVAQAVAVNPAGRIVVTGIVSDLTGPAFPSTAGAYSIANTANHPYLLELDPTGTKTVFSATGIGGSALALDPAGNIYVAGSTLLFDYPTTPGAYQSTFPVFRICIAPCTGTFQGFNQYVTKVDPTGSTLIYSTAVSGNGNTTNAGLAVDAVGNVYLTGYAGPVYPYTVTPPAIPIGPVNSIFFFELPFLSKLDPAGKTLLFSVPVGGAGVQVDSHGAVYVSGGVGSGPNGVLGGIGNNLPALAGVPAQCLPNNLGIRSSAYVSQVDAASGNQLGSQFIGGSTLVTSAVALFGSTVWIAGAATLPDFPLTPNAVTLPSLGPTPLAGAFLGAVDFSQPQPPAGTPRIFCTVDSADLAPVGAAARYQLLTILGTALGPAVGVSSSDNSTATLAGVSVNVGSLSAPLLYVSSTQINFAVPLVDPSQTFATVQLTVSGASAAPRQLPVSFSANPSLFLNGAQTQVSSLGFVVLALNADGSLNSSTNPAKLGSAVSVFVNGLAPDPFNLPVQLSTINGWSVTGIAPLNPFVLRVDLQVPAALVNNFACATSSLCAAVFTLYDAGFVSIGQVVSGGEAFGGLVYVNRTR